MAYTGYLIIQYVDDNPQSPTYGETWTERVASDNCQSGENDNWYLVSSECEMTTSGFTGKRINTYYNDALNAYSSTTVNDSECQESASTWNDEEIWVNSGDPFCEIDEDGLYTGRGIQIQQQKNFNLLNYGETRELEVTLPDCSGYTQPQWEEISHQCHVVTDELTCYLKFDGTADILQIDVNPSSPTFNQTRTIQEESEDCFCEACDSIESSWRYVDRYCGNQVPSSYHLSGLTDNTIYNIYRRYDTCIIGGQSGRTTPTNIYSAQTYQTGVEDCIYRWVETEETVCVEETFNGKVKITYSDSSTYSATCDSNTNLTTATTKPSGYQYTAATDVEIGSCITELGANVSATAGVFRGFTSLSSVTIPNTVTTIGPSAFRQCSGLTSINIPSGVTTIGANAFMSTSLQSIVIPDSSASGLGNSIFTSCFSLTSATLPNNLTVIPNYLFDGCRALTSINIPSGVTTIGSGAFNGCRALTSINIPSGVTTIGSGAFQNCSSLVGITVNALTPPTLANTIVFSNTNNCPIYVPCSSINAYKSATYWSDYADRIQGIGGECFDGKFKATYLGGQTYSAACSSSTLLTTGTTKPSGYQYTAMTSAVIGDCITEIGNYAFEDCSGLTSVTIPDSVTSIDSGAFYGCSGLTSVTIPSGVTSIGDFAFRYCSGLTSITCLATTPPTLGNQWPLDGLTGCPIYVPAASVETYKSASVWSSYSSRITAIPNS